MVTYLLVINNLPQALQPPEESRKLPGYKQLTPLVLTAHPERFARLPHITAVYCTFASDTEIEEALAPYKKDIVAVFCTREANIQFLQRVIPYLPRGVRAPSVAALATSTNKHAMRHALAAHAPALTPAFIDVKDASAESVAAVEQAVPYPVIVKPAGLASSLLIQACRNRAQLRMALTKIFATIAAVYAAQKRYAAPQVLVEEYLEGDFYSVDAYAMEQGRIFCCPPVAYTPNNTRGIHDFSLYSRTIPSQLTPKQTQQAYNAAMQAVAAMGLTWSSAHVELIRTKQGWKVIELGPRVGRYRHRMYMHAYGINHYLNDVRIHLGLAPILPATLQNYCAAYSFYPDKEGILQAVAGLTYLQQNPAVYNVRVRAKIGQQCLFAKHGGGIVAECYVVTPDKDQFEQTTAFINQNVSVVTA